MDLVYMERALALAEETVGLASPNPQVGCVLVRDGRVLGEGAHRYDAFAHAEIVAIKAAQSRGLEVAGATAYVTLEPCSHHGRTGPCADALVAVGVARVVVATADPNPAVAGRGLARLRGAGIVVEVGLMQQRARDLNDAFAMSMVRGRPLVTLKAALSADGKLAPAVRVLAGQPHWLTGPAARADVQRLRHAQDAILTGIGTVLADDPSLTDRTGLPRRRPVLWVVLDRRLRIPLESALVQSAAGDLLVVGEFGTAEGTVEALRGVGAAVELLPKGYGVAAVLQVLHARRVLSVLVEAGPGLNGAFLAAGLVDQAVLYYAETELGAGAIPFAEGVGSPYEWQRTLQRVTERAFPHGATVDARIAGQVRDAWSL